LQLFVLETSDSLCLTNFIIIIITFMFIIVTVTIIIADLRISFWATVCKTVCPILSDHCPSVCPVCLWCLCIVAKRLDGSRCHLVQRQASARPHCVKWGPSSS